MRRPVPTNWNAPRRSIVLLTGLALVPIGLLAASSIVLASNQVTEVVHKRVEATAAVSSVVIGQQMGDLAALVHSYATRPSLVADMSGGSGGDATLEENLTSLAHSTPGISASFVTDLKGNSTGTYPYEPSVLGMNFAYRDWFKGLVGRGRPYVSEAIVTKEAAKTLAVTVTDYVRSPDGRPVGVLGINYSLASIAAYSNSIANAQGITLQVTDQHGTSLTAGGAHGLVSLVRDPRFQAARKGTQGLMDYAQPLPGGRHGPETASAYAPIPETGWTVIASIPKSAAFAGLRHLREIVLGITGLLVLMLLGGARAIQRSEHRRRNSEVLLLSRDRDLRQVLESTDEGYLSSDSGGAITAWNGRAEEIYGWTAPDVLGRNMIDTLVPAAARAEYKRDLAGYRAGAGSAVIGRRLETIALHHDGREIPVEIGSWAHDDDAGFSAFVHDITERVLLQANLEAARDQAMQATAKLSLREAQLESANQKLQDLTVMDALTGIANRRGFDETLNREFRRARRDDASLALIMIDIDHFKSFNDRYGHQAGDDCLRLVATEINLTLERPGDSVSRYGGEELAVILPGTPLDGAVTMADRMRANVEKLAIRHDQSPTGIITISLGVASSKAGTQLSGQNLVRVADKALYSAKAAGRNRVEGVRAEPRREVTSGTNHRSV